MLPRISGGMCSNSTSFEELDPAGWWTCDEGSLPSLYSAYTVIYEDLNSSPSVDSLAESAAETATSSATADYNVDPSK